MCQRISPFKTGFLHIGCSLYFAEFSSLNAHHVPDFGIFREFSQKFMRNLKKNRKTVPPWYCFSSYKSAIFLPVLGYSREKR